MTQVSVVVPAYQAGPYLARCVESILAQAGPGLALEVLVGDDGSTDDTAEVLGRLAADHPEVVVDAHENMGVARTRNRLLDRATGEFVAFVDADDWLEPGHLRHLLDLADGADVVVGGLRRVSSDGRVLGELAPTPGPFGRWILTSACAKLHRRAHLEEHHLRFPEETFGEDGLFTVAELAAGGRWVRSDDRGYSYRYNEESVSSVGMRRFDDHTAQTSARVVAGVADAGTALARTHQFRWFMLRTITFHALYPRRTMTPRQMVEFVDLLFRTAAEHGVDVDSVALATLPPRGERPGAAAAIAALVLARRAGLLPLLARVLAGGR